MYKGDSKKNFKMHFISLNTNNLTFEIFVPLNKIKLDLKVYFIVI
jgi:hypothetical protein